MAESERGRIRTVAWMEICPWLSLYRTFRLAIAPRMLLLSAAALFLTFLGWTLIGYAFSGTNDPALAEQIDQTAPAEGCPWQAAVALTPDQPTCFDDSGQAKEQRAKDNQKFANEVSEAWTKKAESEEVKAKLPPNPDYNRLFEQMDRTRQGLLPKDHGLSPNAECQKLGFVPLPGPIATVARQLSRPFAAAFSMNATFQSLAYAVLCGLWALVVWAILGAAITRTAAVQLAAQERIGWGAMFSHVRAKWLEYLGAPLFPLLVVLGITLLMCLPGLALRTDASLWLAALIWPLMLVGGLVMAVLLLGLIFGWPLMWAAISSEGSDAFDGVSRCYAYTFQRPLHYLFYVVVAGLFGALCWLLVSNFAAGIIHLTYWAASWGCGQARMDAILAGGDSVGAGAAVIRFWVGCVKLLAMGFLYSYFWTAATAIYFLLRRDVDATEMDEVFLDEEAAGPKFGLPPIQTDAQGAPVVDDSAAAHEGEE